MDAKTFDAKTLLDNLFENGILFESGVDGLYGRSGTFEEVIERFEKIVLKVGGPDKATRIHFPPGMARAALEKTGYMKSFPQLAGCVHSFMGDERDHARLLGMMERGEDWTQMQEATEVAMTPAACYPLYPPRRCRLSRRAGWNAAGGSSKTSTCPATWKSPTIRSSGAPARCWPTASGTRH